MTPIYAYQLMSCHIPISCNVSAQHDALNECIRLFTHLSELWPTGHPVVLISDSAARCPDWKVPAEKLRTPSPRQLMIAVLNASVPSAIRTAFATESDIFREIDIPQPVVRQPSVISSGA